MKILIHCSIPGCTNTRLVNQRSNAGMCSECARQKNIERAMFKPNKMPIIREIKQMGAQGWDARDIAEALDRNRKFVQRVLDTPLPDNLQDGSLLKVVRASCGIRWVFMSNASLSKTNSCHAAHLTTKPFCKMERNVTA